jgi:hypothetical protein
MFFKIYPLKVFNAGVCTQYAVYTTQIQPDTHQKETKKEGRTVGRSGRIQIAYHQEPSRCQDHWTMALSFPQLFICYRSIPCQDCSLVVLQ